MNDTINKVESPTVIVTDHAYDRGKERLSLTKKSLDRLAEKAYKEGINYTDMAGKARRYIDKIYHQKEHNKKYTANNIKIHGEVIFLFKSNILITLYQLPNEYKKVIKHFKK